MKNFILPIYAMGNIFLSYRPISPEEMYPI